MRTPLLFSIPGLALCSSIGFGQLNETKLTAIDGSMSQDFGAGVSTSGDYALVGAHHNGATPGSAYIFHYNGVDWVDEAKLTAKDGEAFDYFGYGVSISGDYALVGAFFDVVNGLRSGSAYVFHHDGSMWAEEAKLTASDGEEFDYFGYSVSLSGEYAIVGAFNSNDNGMGSGSAYIFRHDGTNWVEESRLRASDGTAEDYFGYSVSVAGDYAFVGASGDSGFSGSVYVFHHDGADWVEEEKLTASDGMAEDNFGIRVSISGDYALVGAPGEDDHGASSGSAYVFHYDGTRWVEEAKLTASDAEEFDSFGYAVSLSGDKALIGAYGDDDFAGSAYVFHYDGVSWVEGEKLTASDGAEADFFGDAVSLSSAHALIGAFGDDDNGEESGSAYVYSGFSATTAILVPVEVDAPTIFELFQNHPNPFNPSTVIRYGLSQKAHVWLEVFNMLGQSVAVLVDGEQAAGFHSAVFEGKGLASGVYVYRLSAGSHVQSKRLILLR